MTREALRDLYRKETGCMPYSLHCHVVSPTEEYANWLEDRASNGGAQPPQADNNAIERDIYDVLECLDIDYGKMYPEAIAFIRSLVDAAIPSIKQENDSCRVNENKSELT